MVCFAVIYMLVVRSMRNPEKDGLNSDFAFPDETRKAIYTTNAIELLDKTLWTVTKTRNSFSSNKGVG